MSATAPPGSIEILTGLPQLLRVPVGICMVDGDGRVLYRSDPGEAMSFRVIGDHLDVSPAPGRRAVIHRSGGMGGWTVASFDQADAELVEPFLRDLLDVLIERQRAESDMESISSSSLALLEEVSMIGDLMPQLSTGETEAAVVEMGLTGLLVATSVVRAIYLRRHALEDLAEVVVQVSSSDDDLTVALADYPGDLILARDDGLAWRAMNGSGAAILESVPTEGRLGRPGSPESLACNQVVAAPVRYGAGEKMVTLGALLIMDKRANAYSSSTDLGSQETKLASSVASMLGAMLGTRKVAELNKEMSMAQDLQRQILPVGPPAVRGYELAGRCTTSGAVGGDYYDFLSLPDGRVMAVVADVSGHNLASGMVMVSARTTLRLLTRRCAEPVEIFDELAASLFADLTNMERFITAVSATITPESNRIEIVGAGHNPTMVYRVATGEIVEFAIEDTVLGFLPGTRHTARTIDTAPGDVLLLYTDGVTEAVDENGAMFEEARLGAVLAGAAGGTAEEILAAVFQAVDEYADKGHRGDDISAVVIKMV